MVSAVFFIKLSYLRNDIGHYRGHISSVAFKCLKITMTIQPQTIFVKNNREHSFFPLVKYIAENPLCYVFI